MTRAAFSVVIPTSGRWDLVRDCLDALSRQTRLPDEVLLVCDGTPSPPPGLGAGLGERLRVLRQERGGVSRARNAGIAQARGEVVAFTDDDALPAEGWLASLEECFRDPETAGAGGPVLPLWEAPPPSWVESSRRARGCLGLLDLGSRRRPLDPAADFLIGSNCAFRRESVAEPGGFRAVLSCPGVGECGEDYELSRRIACAGTVLYEPAAVVRHRIPAKRTEWRGVLERAFFYEAVRARLGGRLRPRRGLGEIARREGLLSAGVLLGYFYGRLLRRRDRRIAPAGVLRRTAGAVRRVVRGWDAPVPRYFKLELAPACNLRCLHCGQWGRAPHPDRIPSRRWLELVDEIADWAAPCHLTVSCGEPLLEPAALPVAAAAQRRGITVTLVTNGTLIDASAAARLRQSVLRNLVVSLDGCRPETHDLGRGVPGTHARVLRALDHLAGAGLAPRVSLQALVAGHNLGELADLVRLAEVRGLAGVRFQALLPRGAEWSRLWPRDAGQAARAIDGLLRLKSSGSPVLNPASQLEAMRSYCLDSEGGLPNLLCRCAETCAVDERGAVYLCRAMEPVGDVRSGSLREVWSGGSAGRALAAVRACRRPCLLLNCHYQASDSK
jgi:MoaA/NifB/PqqE/SkfB family radical SAM enzyme/GT2 family glycosyltransferase